MGAATSSTGCCARWCSARRCWSPTAQARSGAGGCCYRRVRCAAVLLAVLAAGGLLWLAQHSQPGRYRPLLRRAGRLSADARAAAAGPGGGRRPDHRSARCWTRRASCRSGADSGRRWAWACRRPTSWAPPADRLPRCAANGCCCRGWSGGWRRRCAARSTGPTSCTRRPAST